MGEGQPASSTIDHYEGLRGKVTAYLGERDLYVVDAFAGADPQHRISVRVVTLDALPRALLRATMFITPTRGESTGSARTRSFCTRRRSRPTRTRTARAPARSSRLHPTRREILIGGTFYAGEIKKSIFTLLNDSLPLEGVFPMHCSANVGDDGDVAIFFGLSGTGKTTLSADPERQLIGDDEHGWGESGRLQLRGRLLCEDDQPLRRRRAGDLRGERTRSGRCSRTSSSTRTAGSTSTTTRRPRTRALPTSSS